MRRLRRHNMLRYHYLNSYLFRNSLANNYNIRLCVTFIFYHVTRWSDINNENRNIETIVEFQRNAKLFYQTYLRITLEKYVHNLIYKIKRKIVRNKFMKLDNKAIYEIHQYDRCGKTKTGSEDCLGNQWRNVSQDTQSQNDHEE